VPAGDQASCARAVTSHQVSGKTGLPDAGGTVDEHTAELAPAGPGQLLVEGRGLWAASNEATVMTTAHRYGL
jgi:hypothetical protein